MHKYFNFLGCSLVLPWNAILSFQILWKTIYCLVNNMHGYICLYVCVSDNLASRNRNANLMDFLLLLQLFGLNRSKYEQWATSAVKYRLLGQFEKSVVFNYQTVWASRVIFIFVGSLSFIPDPISSAISKFLPNR